MALRRSNERMRRGTLARPRRHILVVDDEESLAFFLKQGLLEANAGWQVDIAANGEEAVIRINRDGTTPADNPWLGRATDNGDRLAREPEAQDHRDRNEGADGDPRMCQREKGEAVHGARFADRISAFPLGGCNIT